MNKGSSRAPYDAVLLIPVICLMALGLVVVYSSSSPLASHQVGDANFYLKRQVSYCMLGIVIMILAKNIPCTLYKKLVYPLLIFSLALLVLLFVPGLGHEVGGARRWLRFGSLSMQPTEVVKFSLAVFMAYSMSKKGSGMASFSRGLVPHLFVAGTVMALVVMQPDLGTAVIIGCWLLVMLFVGGVRFDQVFATVLVLIPVTFWLVLHADYRLKRWWAFLRPWEDPDGIGFQIIHSFFAFGSGGILGAGLGNSKQKLFYLPEAHTDFAFSIVAEEMGLVGVTLFILLFGVVIVQGIRISLAAPDLYSSYLAFGLVCFIGIQVLVNMGVVMGLLPTKGLTLPFISYGGSSLIMNLFAAGVLMNISSRS